MSVVENSKLNYYYFPIELKLETKSLKSVVEFTIISDVLFERKSVFFDW